jgi:hypothetical protein
MSWFVGYPQTGLEEINADLLEADLNEAALRQMLSRARCQRCVKVCGKG